MATPYTKEMLEAARKADLYNFVLSKHPQDFKRMGSELSLKDDPSVKVLNPSKYGMFNNDSTRWIDHGASSYGHSGNALDFLVNFMGYDITDAVTELSATEHIVAPEVYKEKAPEWKKGDTVPNLPEKEGKTSTVYGYLCSNRGIPQDIVHSLMEDGLIYQAQGNVKYEIERDERGFAKRDADGRSVFKLDANGEKIPSVDSKGNVQHYSNIIFLSKDKDFAEWKGTTGMRGEFSGVRPDGFWGFTFPKGQKPEVVYVCEAAIDAMSLAAMNRMAGNNQPAAYIATGGATKNLAIDRVIGLGIPTIMAMDADVAGQRAFKDAQKRNPEAGVKCIIPPFNSKDWNDSLKYIIKNDLKIRAKEVPVWKPEQPKSPEKDIKKDTDPNR